MFDEDNKNAKLTQLDHTGNINPVADVETGEGAGGDKANSDKPAAGPTVDAGADAGDDEDKSWREKQLPLMPPMDLMSCEQVPKRYDETRQIVRTMWTRNVGETCGVPMNECLNVNRFLLEDDCCGENFFEGWMGYWRGKPMPEDKTDLKEFFLGKSSNHVAQLMHCMCRILVVVPLAVLYTMWNAFKRVALFIFYLAPARMMYAMLVVMKFFCKIFATVVLYWALIFRIVFGFMVQALYIVVRFVWNTILRTPLSAVLVLCIIPCCKMMCLVYFTLLRWLQACIVAICMALWVYVLNPLLVGTKMCCMAIGKCISAVCRTIQEGCDLMYRKCVQPAVRAVGIVFSAIGRAVAACGKCFYDYVLKPIYDYILTPIYNYILTPIYNILAAIVGVFVQVLTAIGNAIGQVLSAIGNAISSALTAISRAMPRF